MQIEPKKGDSTKRDRHLHLLEHKLRYAGLK